MNDLKIFVDTEELIFSLAEKVVMLAEESIEHHGRFDFVLSGGGSPKRLYELLASDAYKNEIEWDKVYFFFGDERFVPDDDERKNFNMVRKALFEPLNIKATNIFKVDTSETPEISAQKYRNAIQKHFDGNPVEFDLTLLGLGDNSHTASLFPHTEILKEKEATVKAVFVKEVDMYRISMTAALINQSKNIVFLIFGKGKAEAVYHILEDKTGTVEEHPARLIQSEKNDIEWFMDREASSELKNLS